MRECDYINLWRVMNSNNSFAGATSELYWGYGIPFRIGMPLNETSNNTVFLHPFDSIH